MEVSHYLQFHYVPPCLHGHLYTPFKPKRVGERKDTGISFSPLPLILLSVSSLDQKHSLLLLCLI